MTTSFLIFDVMPTSDAAEPHGVLCRSLGFDVKCWAADQRRDALRGFVAEGLRSPSSSTANDEEE